MEARVSVVVITRDRAELLAATLHRLSALPERPPVIVVDNGSTDGTAAMVRREQPGMTVVALPVNRGAAARQIGARLAATPYVAFADDDSWWAPGSLARAVDYLDEHPMAAVVAARVLVGDEERLDATSALMAASPLGPASGGEGRAVLGFMACAAVVRRQPFLHAGGFPEPFGVGGEEEPLALALAADGWELVHLDELVVHHHPAPGRDAAGRRRIQARNAVWTAWLWRSPGDAARVTWATLVRAGADPAVGRGMVDAARGWRWVRRQRRRVPPSVERALRRLEAGCQDVGGGQDEAGRAVSTRSRG